MYTHRRTRLLDRVVVELCVWHSRDELQVSEELGIDL